MRFSNALRLRRCWRGQDQLGAIGLLRIRVVVSVCVGACWVAVVLFLSGELLFALFRVKCCEEGCCAVEFEKSSKMRSAVSYSKMIGALCASIAPPTYF